jgi:hypothetical protein
MSPENTEDLQNVRSVILPQIYESFCQGELSSIQFYTLMCMKPEEASLQLEDSKAKYRLYLETKVSEPYTAPSPEFIAKHQLVSDEGDGFRMYTDQNAGRAIYFGAEKADFRIAVVKIDDATKNLETVYMGWPRNEAQFEEILQSVRW